MSMGVSKAQNGKAHSRWQGDDDLFFHKRQIRLEVVLLCMGRLKLDQWGL